MSPRFLGISVAILAFAFILALPEAFEGEPADEVEPIRFGPRPEAGLDPAKQVPEGSPGQPGRSGSVAPSAAPLPGPVEPPGPGAAPGDPGEGEVTRADDGDDDASPGPTSPDDDSGGGAGDTDDRPVRQPDAAQPAAPPPPPPPDDDDRAEPPDVEAPDDRHAPAADEGEVDD